MLPADLDDLMEIFGDPKVMAAFNSPPFSFEEMDSWLNRNLAHQDQYGYGLFSVIHKSDQKLIGDCGLEHMELQGKRETELGYDFRSDYWNQSYATEAAAGVLDYAYKTQALPSLISLIRVGNEASRRVAEKIGMQLQAEMSINGITYWSYFISKVKVELI